MTEKNIVALFRDSGQHTASMPRDRDLFGCAHEARGKVVFLDEADWREETLLQLMTSNPVGAVVDLRARPIFRLPRFRHRHVVSYFHKHAIQYLEYARILREYPPEGAAGIDKLASILFSRSDVGLTICLYDETTKQRGWLASIRQTMRLSPEHFVELHPSALNGPHSLPLPRR
jgi:hypothetical protein